MKAIAISAPGPAEVLRQVELPDPEPGKGEILIAVHAVGLNRADLLQRQGLYPPPPGINPAIPGLEVAGVVESSRDPAGRFSQGDRVMALLSGEGYAQKAVVPACQCIPLPQGLSFEEGAAIPEAFLTAHDALFSQLELCAGETVLIHAVGSGVGTAALQLARASAVEVIGTSRQASKIDWAKEYGLEEGVDTTISTWASEVREISTGEGVDAILDLVGAAHWEENLDLLKPQGRLIIVGLVSGSRVTVDLGTILRKRLRILGTALRSRSGAEKAALVAEFQTCWIEAFERKRLRPVIDRVFSWEDVIDAHRYMEGNRNFGKIVLSVGQGTG